MSAVRQAEEKVVAAALSLAASRAYLDTVLPGPYDDAELELKHDMLGEALAEYVKAVKPDPLPTLQPIDLMAYNTDFELWAVLECGSTFLLHAQGPARNGAIRLEGVVPGAVGSTMIKQVDVRRAGLVTGHLEVHPLPQFVSAGDVFHLDLRL